MASAGRFIMDALGDAAAGDRESEQEHYVGAGAPRQGATEEEVALNKKNGAALLARAVKEDEDARRKEEKKKRRMQETEWGAFHRRWILGIKDHDSPSFMERGFAHGPYLSLTPSGKMNPHTKEREVSDAQILAIIGKLVLEKGYTELYCYKGNAIDPYLTSRMNNMLQKMMFQGEILEGRHVEARNVKMDGIEPWHGWWLGKMANNWRSIHRVWKEKAVIPYHIFKLHVATNDMLGNTSWMPRVPKMKDVTPSS